MTKIIKEMLPPDVRVARDAQDLLIECCVGKKIMFTCSFNYISLFVLPSRILVMRVSAKVMFVIIIFFKLFSERKKLHLYWVSPSENGGWFATSDVFL